MASKKKLLQAAAGSAGGASLDVDDVFSCHLYDGSSSAQTITNGIDLSGEGGLVWIRDRDNANGNYLFDTERGATKRLRTHGTQAENTVSTGLTAFNSNGFTIGSNAFMNGNGNDIVSWTWRKAPKFFDVVTYTGNGVAGRTISHNLDNLVGMLMIKCTSHTSDWSVQHRMLLPTKYLALNETQAQQTDTARFHSTAAGTSTFTVGSGDAVNGSGRTYVAYLFSHNNSGNPGEFGPDSDQDIIKCGSYTGNGSATGPVIDLGFEPQWIIVKGASQSSNWTIIDSMRGIAKGANAEIMANLSNAEGTVNYFDPQATGFQLTQATYYPNSTSETYIYMAIRRGPLAAPTDATKVFAIDDSSTTDIGGYTLNSNFPVDLYFFKNKDGGDSISIPRLTVGDLRFNSTGAEENRSSVMNFDSNTGVTRTSFQGGIDSVDYAFRRAPGYFDVVAYTGTGSARTVSHNLGVEPEMMWVKRRDGTSDWAVYHKGLNGGTDPEDYFLKLNGTNAASNSSTRWNDTAPTSSVFTVGTSGSTNDTNFTYIAYLFATVAGVSKVGSYTGNGGTQNIDCGFSSGARFVLLKNTSSSDNWPVFDSTRGIVAGNDSHLSLNHTHAEASNTDYIDPLSSGFAVTGNDNMVNKSGETYIFYAIA